jgi:hypothetical protein
MEAEGLEGDRVGESNTDILPKKQQLQHVYWSFTFNNYLLPGPVRSSRRINSAV